MRALLAAAGVAAAEIAARRAIESRSQAWLVVYGALGAASLAVPSRHERRPVRRARLVAGAALALAGYPLGRALLRSRGTGRPPDSLGTELAALGLVVPLAEERIWGGIVEPSAGPAATATLFAAKHAAVDGRCDRVVGLWLFWWGLAQVRRASPWAGLVLHCAANAGGVLLGHAVGRDQF